MNGKLDSIIYEDVWFLIPLLRGWDCSWKLHNSTQQLARKDNAYSKILLKDKIVFKLRFCSHKPRAVTSHIMLQCTESHKALNSCPYTSCHKHISVLTPGTHLQQKQQPTFSGFFSASASPLIYLILTALWSLIILKVQTNNIYLLQRVHVYTGYVWGKLYSLSTSW